MIAAARVRRLFVGCWGCEAPDLRGMRGLRLVFLSAA